MTFLRIHLSSLTIEGIQFTPNEIIPLPPEGRIHVEVPGDWFGQLFGEPWTTYKWHPATRKVLKTFHPEFETPS